MNNLKDLRILVTRPKPQGDALCLSIKNLGGYPIHFPTIDFAPPQNKQAFQESVKKLGEQDWLIFISPQAVYSSIPQIRRSWPNFPETVRFAAVGEGTANALKQAGYNAILFPDSEHNSEALLDLPEFTQIRAKKIAVIRGDGGRELLDKTLAERGAEVLSVIAYQRILPNVNVSDCLERLRKHEIDIIVCTSFEGVKNLKILLGDTGWPYLQEIPVIVMSERIKLLAEDLGFRRIWVTPHASEKALLATIVEIRKTFT